jgi:hypothetical protein
LRPHGFRARAKKAARPGMTKERPDAKWRDPE